MRIGFANGSFNVIVEPRRTKGKMGKVVRQLSSELRLRFSDNFSGKVLMENL